MIIIIIYDYYYTIFVLFCFRLLMCCPQCHPRSFALHSCLFSYIYSYIIFILTQQDFNFNIKSILSFLNYYYYYY